ncbi:MAG: hypothetical protein IIY21_04000 [Clostridiales bacterium]|nr:hypothetical protein [Clostridiales bacterium]MBQ1575135.1 hypothetical protein [Clostridiales bacterium]
MNELISVLETEIALETKHLNEDEQRIGDPILGQFFRGRAAVEKGNLETLKRLMDIANKMI